jgi:hypothetical protein
MGAKFTPGPWAWFGNAKGRNIYLATIHSGRRFVMQFGRWGMNSAQPIFQDRAVMRPAVEFLKFEVGNPEVTGFEAAQDDPSVYRYDIRDIDHPDARLIAAAPELAAVAKRYEAWEARLILCDEAWSGGVAPLPTLTDELWDELLEIQRDRNEAIGKAGLRDGGKGGAA